jgi:argininosuccinate synthase
MKKAVLAFSGGLDTSFCIPYLKHERGLEVHTVLVNTGGFSNADENRIKTHAMALGAASHTTIDAIEEYYSKGIRYLIFGNVLKNATYPLSVSSERVFQALAVLKHTRAIQASYVAHGSTGAGNDQVRFDLVFEVMAPDIQIVAPVRELALSRQEEIDYLAKNGCVLAWDKAKYSVNQGLWGTSIGGAETLHSGTHLPSDAYPSQRKKTTPETVRITFHKGEPIALNDTTMAPVTLIQRLNAMASDYAIGRDTHVGDTIIGIKGRVSFEAAAPMILIKSHHLLEKHTLTKGQLYWKEQLANWYGQLIHEAQYLDPLARNIESFLEDTQKFVCGTVEVELRPYRFSLLGCSSPYDLMNAKFGTYGEASRSITGTDVIGFTKVLANPLKIYYAVHENN